MAMFNSKCNTLPEGIPWILQGSAAESAAAVAIRGSAAFRHVAFAAAAARRHEAWHVGHHGVGLELTTWRWAVGTDHLNFLDTFWHCGSLGSSISHEKPKLFAAARPFDAWKSPLAARESGEGDPIFHFDARHPHWSGVEVVTCVSGGRYVNVMDFPVFHLLRASTPLPVHNVCENHEWDGMYMRLRFYRNFLEKYLAETGVQRPRLFIISDGMDAIICFRPEYFS